MNHPALPSNSRLQRPRPKFLVLTKTILIAKSDRSTMEERHASYTRFVGWLIPHENSFASTINNDEEPTSL
jgi:hypothetical protein